MEKINTKINIRKLWVGGQDHKERQNKYMNRLIKSILLLTLTFLMLNDHRLLYGVVKLYLLYSKSCIFNYLWSFLTKYLSQSGKDPSYTYFLGPRSYLKHSGLDNHMSYENNVFSTLLNGYISDPHCNQF